MKMAVIGLILVFGILGMDMYSVIKDSVQK